MRLGPTEVALRPRSPSSQSGASRIEWKFDFSSREWMHCLVECKQLGSAWSMWCNMCSGRQQTRARKRVLNRTLHSNKRYTRRGVHVFLFGFRGFLVHLEPTKPKTVGPGVVSLRESLLPSRYSGAERELAVLSLAQRELAV